MPNSRMMPAIHAIASVGVPVAGSSGPGAATGVEGVGSGLLGGGDEIVVLVVVEDVDVVAGAVVVGADEGDVGVTVDGVVDVVSGHVVLVSGAVVDDAGGAVVVVVSGGSVVVVLLVVVLVVLVVVLVVVVVCGVQSPRPVDVFR